MIFKMLYSFLGYLMNLIGPFATFLLVGLMPMYVHGFLAFRTGLLDPRRGKVRRGYKIASLIVAVALSLFLTAHILIVEIVRSAWG